MTARKPVWSITRHILWLLIAGLCACGGGSSGSTSPAPSDPPSTTSLADIVQSAVDKGVNGIIVYIDQNGREPQLLAAGQADALQQTPMQGEQLFKVASISKLFIAVAMTKLAAENTLGLDDTLATWLPEYAGRIANAEQVTLRMLIQHRSGIPDFDSQPGFSWQDPHTDWDDTLALILDRSADFAPNAREEYSNTNYLLLAMVMDRALGFSHYDYIQQSILDPLAMFDTYHTYDEALAGRVTSGYWQGSDREHQDYRIPGGAMVATATDIGRLIRALNDGTLLTQQEQSLYPYWYQHSGWLPGYQSVATYQNNGNAVVIQFINTTGDNSEDVAQSTYQALLDAVRF